MHQKTDFWCICVGNDRGLYRINRAYHIHYYSIIDLKLQLNTHTNVVIALQVNFINYNPVSLG